MLREMMKIRLLMYLKAERNPRRTSSGLLPHFPVFESVKTVVKAKDNDYKEMSLRHLKQCDRSKDSRIALVGQIA